MKRKEARWIPLQLLLDPVRHCLTSVPGLPVEMLFPAIDLNRAVPLWGFTYRMMTDWLGLVPVERIRRQAGFDGAAVLLEFLLPHGLNLTQGWVDQARTGPQPVEAAAVSG
ncbi:MAG TPA: hypothetical protein VN442_17180 [Bryobacteraceae bacterium]|nr:hypothetical protein [Bryobacteraceae bacterium]HWR35828.1 hypothetical protein [Clostridia bacterium]